MLLTILAAIVAVFCCWLAFLRINRATVHSGQFTSIWTEKRGRESCSLSPNVESRSRQPIIFDFDAVRMWYHWLHHVEHHMEELPTARTILENTIDIAVQHSRLRPSQHSISTIVQYEENALRSWIEERDTTTFRRFEAYCERRSNRGHRELLPTQQDASNWLRKQAPLRYVDGAWLGNLSRVSMLWPHKTVIRQLWQILSEELGDGDFKKHHTFLYRQLLQTVAPDMPEAHCAEFTNISYGATNEQVWRSAVLQLLISLFHEEFLPEILGFNLHFEGITLEILQAATELKELGIDSTYFMLHASIDNGASGHTAMALEAVQIFLRQVQEQQGLASLQETWRRVQAGYLLSEGAWDKAHQHDLECTSNVSKIIAKIFESKAVSGSGVHCASKVKIGGRRISDWLDRRYIGKDEWWQELVQSLRASPYWIQLGQSDGSRFMHELTWGGRMFGAFTNHECSIVRRWIDCSTKHRHDYNPMPPELNHSARQLTRPGNQSNATKLPDVVVGCAERVHRCSSKTSVTCIKYKLDTKALEQARWLPAVWFSHFCLLEGFVAIPSKNGNPLGATVLRILRAQYGFKNGQDSISGTDITGSEKDQIFDVGSQILKHHGFPSSLSSLTSVIGFYPCGELPQVMMTLCKAPSTFPALLLGMAASFVSFHRAIADLPALDASSRSLLHYTTDMEEEAFLECLELLQHDSDGEIAFARGFFYVRMQLDAMLSSPPPTAD